MVKEWKWFGVERATLKNEIRLASESNLKYEIKFFDKLGNEVRKYDDLEHTGAKSKAEIILEYESGRTGYTESSLSEVTYRFVDGARNNARTLKKAVHEAYMGLFKDRYKNDFNNDYLENSTDISYRLVDKGKNGISLDLRKKGNPSLNTTINNEDVKMTFYSYLTKRISLEDQLELLEIEGSKPYWTPKKIIFCTFLVVFFLLIIIFWKKIWGWIRGKSKQEKKIEEQIDIF